MHFQICFCFKSFQFYDFICYCISLHATFLEDAFIFTPSTHPVGYCQMLSSLIAIAYMPILTMECILTASFNLRGLLINLPQVLAFQSPLLSSLQGYCPCLRFSSFSLPSLQSFVFIITHDIPFQDVHLCICASLVILLSHITIYHFETTHNCF